jgi:hypothetical protein
MKTIAPEINIGRVTARDDSWLGIVRQQVGSLRFGVVQIVVHEARVVQIERTEKVRLSPPLADPSPLPYSADRKTGG